MLYQPVLFCAAERTRDVAQRRSRRTMKFHIRCLIFCESVNLESKSLAQDVYGRCVRYSHSIRTHGIRQHTRPTTPMMGPIIHYSSAKDRAFSRISHLSRASPLFIVGGKFPHSSATGIAGCSSCVRLSLLPLAFRAPPPTLIYSKLHCTTASTEEGRGEM